MLKNTNPFLFTQKKLIERYGQLKKHPLVDSPIIGIVKYSLLNIFLRIRKKPIIWNWFNNIKYYLTIGDSCLISNCYFYIDDYEEILFIINYLDKDETFVAIGFNQGIRDIEIVKSRLNKKTVLIDKKTITIQRHLM